MAEGPRSAGVERAKTSPIGSAPASAREVSSNNRFPVNPAPGVARSNTQITPGRASANAAIGGPVRGLSVRRPGASPGTANQPAPPPKGK